MGLNRIIDWIAKLIVDVIVWWKSSRYKRERLHIEDSIQSWHENMNQHRQKFQVHDAGTQATTSAQTIAMSAMTPSQFRGYLGIMGSSGVSGYSGYSGVSGYITMADGTNSIVIDPPQLDLPQEMADWENACSVCHMTGVPLIKFSKSDELYCRDCISKLKGGS